MFADPVQQMTVAPQAGWRFLIQLVVAQQALREEMLGHVQAPGQMRTRGLPAFEDLQQQVFEADSQLVAQTHEQRRRGLAFKVDRGIVAIFVAAVLQRTLPFE
ncbi:hypothetical protein D9M69_679130 [compost metagenome]